MSSLMSDNRDYEINRLSELYTRSFADDVTDEELAEFDRLDKKYADYHPDNVPPLPPMSPPMVLPTEFSIPEKIEVFTEHEIGIIAESQRCSVKQLRRRWIIQSNSAFYVIGPNGRYQTPITRAELAVSLPRDLARVPSEMATDKPTDGHIAWEKIIGDKAPVKRNVDDLLSEYSTVARRIVASMEIPHSYFDPKTQTYYERVCERRELVPMFHGDVDQWLTLLGGVDADRLKDWVATSVRLDRPTPGIYLHAPAACGKTMFADGLARVWSEAPTEMDSVVSSFNSMMANNPIVFADEALPKGLTSSFIRRFIAQQSHSLRRKNAHEAQLSGYFRVIIAANNPNLFKFEHEEFEHEDVAAIAARILYIQCDPRAADYLRSIGGRAATDSWVNGDKIAQHALWLAQTRHVEVGSRFLIENTSPSLHRNIASNGILRGQVIEHICRSLLRKDWGPGSKPNERGVQVGGGHVYVNTGFLADSWTETLSQPNVPSLKAIGMALKPLAIVSEDGRFERKLRNKDRRVMFYNVDPQHVYDAADSMQLASVEDFKALIDAPHLYADVIEGGVVTPQRTSSAGTLFDLSIQVKK
jgi:hypothetical protein